MAEFEFDETMPRKRFRNSESNGRNETPKSQAPIQYIMNLEIPREFNKHWLWLYFENDAVEGEFLRFLNPAEGNYTSFVSLLVACAISAISTVLLFANTYLYIALIALGCCVAFAISAAIEFFVIVLIRAADPLNFETQLRYARVREFIVTVNSLIIELLYGFLSYPIRDRIGDDTFKFIVGDAEKERELGSRAIVYSYWIIVGWWFIAVERPRSKWIFPIGFLALLATFCGRFLNPCDTISEMIGAMIIEIEYIAFLCVVRWSQESQQRRQFEDLFRCQWALIEYEANTTAITEFVDSIIPPAVLAKLTTKIAAADVSPDATVVMMDIDDFVTVSTTMLPLRVAIELTRVRSIVEEIFVQVPDVHRGPSLGDMTVGTCNLLTRCDYHGVISLWFALRVSDVCREQLPEGFGLRVIVHTGELIGATVTSHYIRYDLFGECIDTARVLLSWGQPEQVLLTEFTLEHCDARVTVIEAPPAEIERRRIDMYRAIEVDDATAASMSSINKASASPNSIVQAVFSLSSRSFENRESGEANINIQIKQDEDKSELAAKSLVAAACCGWTMQISDAKQEQEFVKKEKQRMHFLHGLSCLFFGVFSCTVIVLGLLVPIPDGYEKYDTKRVLGFAGLAVSAVCFCLVTAHSFLLDLKIASSYWLCCVLTVVGCFTVAFSCEFMRPNVATNDNLYVLSLLSVTAIFFPFFVGKHLAWLGVFEFCVVISYLLSPVFFSGIRLIMSILVLIVEACFTTAIYERIGRRQRFWFLTVKAQESTAQMLRENEEQRKKILSIILPAPLLPRAMSRRLYKDMDFVNDEMVVVFCRIDSVGVNVLANKVTNLVEAISNATSAIENFVAKVNESSKALYASGTDSLIIVKLMGNHIVILGGLEDPALQRGTLHKERLVHRSCIATASFFNELRNCTEQLSVVATVDHTIAVVSNAIYPTFDLFGVGVHQARSLLSAASPTSLLLTSKFASMYELARTDTFAEHGIGPMVLSSPEKWRLRGMGQRMVHHFRSKLADEPNV